MEDIIKIDSVETYNELFGLETRNPLVAVVDLAKATRCPERLTANYGVYALFLKNVKCGNIRYGRQPYDYQAGTVVSFAPGQVVETELLANIPMNARGLLFHPDLIKGTALGHDIRDYSFFGYDSREALHLSDEERAMVSGCLDNLAVELERPVDRMSRKVLTSHIQLLLDYCLRFYGRQFATRETVNRDVLTRFESLVKDYFDSEKPQMEGLPTVKYFADGVYLSPNYFGDLVKRETGRTPQEYIQSKLIDRAKQMLAGTERSVSEIAFQLGFQYSQHFNRMFKKNVGLTPSEYRRAGMAF